MFKEKSPAAPHCILKKVSSFLKLPIILISRRMIRTKPAIPIRMKIISLKKSRKKMVLFSRRHRRRHDQYNSYGYQFQYQYCYNSKPLLKKKNGHRYASEYLYRNPVPDILGKCLGMMKTEHGCRNNRWVEVMNDQDRLVSPSPPLVGGLCGGGDGELDDDSIDERAEKFIERFYEEMRLQRQDSFLSF